MSDDRPHCDVCGNTGKGLRRREEVSIRPDTAGWIRVLCTACVTRLSA